MRWLTGAGATILVCALTIGLLFIAAKLADFVMARVRARYGEGAGTIAGLLALVLAGVAFYHLFGMSIILLENLACRSDPFGLCGHYR